MTPFEGFVLFVQGVAFIAWVIVTFKILFLLRQRAVARTGKQFPGMGITLEELRRWWGGPDNRGFRRLFVALSLFLVLFSIAGFYVELTLE